jgi:Beta-lactamase class A
MLIIGCTLPEIPGLENTQTAAAIANKKMSNSDSSSTSLKVSAASKDNDSQDTDSDYDEAQYLHKNISTDKKDYSQLTDKIQAYLKAETGTYGIYFLSLTNNESFGINESEDYCAASTVKVPVVLYLYHQISLGNLTGNEMVTYTNDDYETGTGDIQYSEIGTQYSLSSLAKLAIEVSDNVAVNMLIRFLDRDKIYDFQEQIVGHSLQRSGNISSPKDMTMYLKWLLYMQEIYPNEADTMLNYLENTIFNDRINLYLPKEVTVAHKIGNQVNTLNDVGVVYANKPYIISFMTKDIDENCAKEVIATISKMVYDFEQN